MPPLNLSHSNIDMKNSTLSNYTMHYDIYQVNKSLNKETKVSCLNKSQGELGLMNVFRNKVL